MLEIKFDTNKLNLVCKYKENTNEITVNTAENKSPQNIKKLTELVFSFPDLFFVVFKSFLVTKQITPKFKIEQIITTANTFKGESIPAIKIATPVNKIEIKEVILQNNILLNTIFLGVIGKVFNKLKNLPSLEILFAQNEFNIIENILIEQSTIS